jgi:uncharacterized protein (TIGR03083 family)
MSLPPAPSVPTDREALLAALESTWSAVAGLAAAVSEDEALLPSPCPGWNVRDQVAHVTGLESRFLGRPGPDSHQLPDTLSYVTTDMQRFMERDVDSRRSLPWPVVQAETAEVLQARAEQLRALPFDETTMMDTPFGSSPAPSALSLRAFDVWAHEQDIRDALGQPGGMDSAAAGVSIARCVAALGYIAKTAGLSGTEAVQVDVPDGRFAFTASTNPAMAPTATLTIDAATFTRLCCGRSTADRSSVRISGDRGIGERFLDNMAVTP